MTERVVTGTLDLAFKIHGHFRTAGFAVLYMAVAASWLWFLKEAVLWLVAPAVPQG